MLAAGDDELSVRDDDDALSEAAGREMRYTRGVWMITWLDLDFVMCATASRPQSSEIQVLADVTGAKNFDIFICYCYIRVLPIKTNPMIYNMLYKI